MAKLKTKELTKLKKILNKTSKITDGMAFVLQNAKDRRMDDKTPTMREGFYYGKNEGVSKDLAKRILLNLRVEKNKSSFQKSFINSLKPLNYKEKLNFIMNFLKS